MANEKKIRGRIVAIATALSPIRHGGGTMGNVQQFRRHDVWGEHGRESVPYISGNSIKHFVREGSAHFALEALGMTGGMTRAEVQLAFSGGALTKSGQSIRLDKCRQVEQLFPALGLCGYSAGNVMTESQVRVDFWEVACRENAGRLRTTLEAYLPERLPCLEKYGSDYLTTHFGTRHEPTRRRHLREKLGDMERAEVEAEISEKMTAKDADKGDSLQMVYEYEVLVPGTVMVGGFTFPHGITPRELAAFRSAFTWASEGVADDGGLIIRIGGGGATGYGRVSVQLHGLLAQGIEPMRYTPTDELVPQPAVGEGYDEALVDYITYLHDHREDVATAFGELTG